MVHPASLLEARAQQLRQDPTINQVYNLAKELATMVRGRQVEELGDWLICCQGSSTTLLQHIIGVVLFCQ